MRRQDYRHHVPQLDLFRPEAPNLEWSQLPVDVRGKAMRLMARMLRERQHLRADEATAGGHDDE